MFKRKDKTNGNDRGTKKNSQDPGAGKRSTTPTAASNLPLQGAFSSKVAAAHKARVAYATGGPIGPSVTAQEYPPVEPQVETVESEIPILAKRSAYLSLAGPFEQPFASMAHQGTFGILSKAACTKGGTTYYSGGYQRYVSPAHPDSDAPFVGCSCGFYALPLDADSMYDCSNQLMLLVELSGKVIEHELGFRAQYQKVVECQIPPCIYCTRASDHVLLTDDFLTKAYVCDNHVATSPLLGHIYLDVESLSFRLGVPVTRLELSPPELDTGVQP